MSVPKSFRKDSSMAYVYNAEKLAAKVFRFANNLPKRYTFKLGNPVFEHAEMVVFHVKAANITYVNDDAAFAQRRSHLTEAEAHLLHVETLLGILHETTLQLSAINEAKKPNDNVYMEFAELIEKERKLISGCKRKDTNVYNKRRKQGA